MVYFYTSSNVKHIMKLIKEYESVADLSPFEYSKSFLEKCTDDSADAKIGWITETFLGVHKHFQFLHAVANSHPEEMLDEEQLFLMIILYGIIFHLKPNDGDQLYKCMFNLSRSLLHSFSKLFGNKQSLSYVSTTAQNYYDVIYVSENIIKRLAQWQPAIQEMSTKYAEFVYKNKTSKMRQVTVPIQPKVLDRKSKLKNRVDTDVVPSAPPNSVLLHKKMLEKSIIDQRLKASYEKNKIKAKKLLVDSKNFDHHTRCKNEKHYDDTSQIRDQDSNQNSSPKAVKKYSHTVPKLPIKETATTIKRLKHRILQEEQDEVSWLERMLQNCSNCKNVEDLQDKFRQERERERLVEIERKHLMGQISHEDAIISKQKLIEQNKRNHEEFLKEREGWYSQIDAWKLSQVEYNRKQVEKLSLLELNLLEAKNNVLMQRKENANIVKSENEVLRNKALREKNEELERRATLIKELKVLSMIARKARISKVIDLTETAGFGFLCEMSIAELQERLTMVKMNIKEELQKKKDTIAAHNSAVKKDLEETKVNIKSYFSEKALRTAQNKKHEDFFMNASSSKDLDQLKKKLDEKRKLRMKMTNLA